MAKSQKGGMKYGNLTLGQIEAGINKLGGEEAFLKLLRDELSVSKPTCSWREEDGIIYFSVTSDGTTGEDWIKRLESKGFRFSKWAKDVLNSTDFKPTTGIMNNIAVLKGELFKDSDRITKNIRNEADKRKLTTPNAEVACLIREKFTDKEIEQMGFWYIVAMHEPINDSDGDPDLLRASRNDAGRWLYAYYDRPGHWWLRVGGFAFVASQVPST